HPLITDEPDFDRFSSVDYYGGKAALRQIDRLDWLPGASQHLPQWKVSRFKVRLYKCEIVARKTSKDEILLSGHGSHSRLGQERTASLSRPRPNTLADDTYYLTRRAL